MPKIISPTDRRRMAEKASINEQYLYQCLTGRRDMGAIEARRVVDALEGELSLRDVCPNTWQLIWPDLMADSTEKQGA